MSNKKYYGLFVVSTILTVLWGLLSAFVLFLLSSHAARTYYPVKYWGAEIFVGGILLALISLSVGFFLKWKGKKAIICFIAAVLLVVLGFAARACVIQFKEDMVANKFGFRVMQEKTYSVYGLDYKMPANWRKDLNQTNDYGEYKYHFPYPQISFERGEILVYGFGVEYSDTDFTGDYRAFLDGYFSDAKNYRILNSEFQLNQKFNFTAQKLECVATFNDTEHHYLIYLVQDRENNKMYMVSYRKPAELTVWDRADFDVIIDNLD